MIRFFALVSRLKYIDRWALMKNSSNENLAEHSLETAVIAHALCIIGNERCGKKLDADHAAVLAMYHDASEIITGDMPTPIKYLNADIKSVYKDIEKKADARLLEALPEDLRTQYQPVFDPGEEYAYEKRLVKAADKLSAYIKCIEERKSGNREFENAEKATLQAVISMNLPEVAIYLDECIPAYELNLDQLK